MDRTVNICRILYQKAVTKYGKSAKTPSILDEEIADVVLSQIEEIISSNGNITQESSLDFDIDDDVDYYDSGEEAEGEVDASQSSQGSSCSQEWEVLTIDSEQFTLEYMKKIIDFYDQAKTKKFERTQKRFPRIRYSVYITRFRE